MLTEELDDPHLFALVADARTINWAIMEGTNDVAMSVKGSKVGGSLADTAYNLVLIPVIGDILYKAAVARFARTL